MNREKLKELIKRFEHNAEYERTHGNLQGCLEFKALADDLKKLENLKEQESFINKACVSQGVCEHDKNSVLEDIKAEIEELDYVTFDNITKKECIRIIDKHMSKEKQTIEVKVW